MKYLNKSAKVTYNEKREIDVDKMVLNINYLQSCMKYKPKTLDEGVKDFVANLFQAKPYEK